MDLVELIHISGLTNIHTFGPKIKTNASQNSTQRIFEGNNKIFMLIKCTTDRISRWNNVLVLPAKLLFQGLKH